MAKQHIKTIKSMLYETGGEVELEGNELIETPDGEIINITGPSHDQGGIPFTVVPPDFSFAMGGKIGKYEHGGMIPDGTKVYTDKVQRFNPEMEKAEGMKERKIRRTEVEDKLAKVLGRTKKKLDKNPTDKLALNTYKKTASNLMQQMLMNQAEDEADVALMDVMGNVSEKKYGGKVKKKIQLGGGIYDTLAYFSNLYKTDNRLSGLKPEAPNKNLLNFLGENDPGLDFTGVSPEYMKRKAVGAAKEVTSDPTRVGGGRSAFAGDLPTVSDTDNVTPRTVTDDEAGPVENAVSNRFDSMTLGNKLGIAGVGIGSISPMVMSAISRLTDEPNPNFFSGLTNDVLMENTEALRRMEAGRDQALSEANLSTRSLKESLRGSTTSVSGLRTANIAATTAGQRQDEKIATTYFDKLAGLMGDRARLKFAAKQTEQAGAERAFDKDVADKDAFLTSMTEGMVGAGAGLQAAGKTLNQQLYNEQFLNILPFISKYVDPEWLQGMIEGNFKNTV